MTDWNKLAEDTGRDLRRLEESERRPPTFVGIVLYGGTLGLLFIVPIVAGAYLGHWLDSLATGYSVRWTVSLIVLGIALGTYNVVRFIRERT
jgi:ATP synthase protein I